MNFHEAVNQWLKTQGIDSKEVTDVKQYEVSGGYCYTCAWTEINVLISYVDSSNKEQKYEYDGYMTEFIKQLENA